jgi:hypothetical protein
MNNPLGARPSRSPALIQSPAPRSGEVEDDMFSAAANRQDGAALEAASLPCSGSFEGLAMGTEPGLEDSVAAHAGVDAARNGLYLGEFRHPAIVEDARPGAGSGKPA